MATEQIDPRYLELDAWDDAEALAALYEGQLAAVAAVGPALPAIAAAVRAAVPRLGRRGRLIYIGAGTSARIGVQDGAELPPTFSWPHEQLAFVIAGGEGALTRAVENAEDSSADGAAQIAALGAGADDVAIALAASGATPFTLGALGAARAAGALCIGVANNADAPLFAHADHAILIDTGAEAIAGSTRLKAGTAQKAALNLFSTLAMVRLGKVYRGLMVDMRATNEKLRRRSVEIVAAIAGVTREAAARALADADGELKLAALIARGMGRDAAAAALAACGGSLRAALGGV